MTIAIRSAIRNILAAILMNPWASASAFSGWLWGIALAMPGDTLARPTYRYMAFVASEDYWTVAFLTVATLQTWRLFKRTTVRLFPYELALKAVACAMWTFTGLVCMAAQWPLAAAMSDTLVVALFSWIDMSQCKPCHGCSYKGSVYCQQGCHLTREADHVD